MVGTYRKHHPKMIWKQGKVFIICFVVQNCAFFYKYLKNSSLLCFVALLAFEFEIKKRNRIFEFYVFHYLRGFFGSRAERKMEFLMMNGNYKGP